MEDAAEVGVRVVAVPVQQVVARGQIVPRRVGGRVADGVELVGDTIYVSSWSLGKVWKYDLKRKALTLVSDDFTTAADLFFDQKTRQIIVPDMIDGTLTFLPLN